MSYFLVFVDQSRQYQPSEDIAENGGLVLRPCGIGGWKGLEPWFGSEPLLDCLRRKPGKHDALLFDALGLSARLMAAIPEVVLVLCEGDDRVTPQTGAPMAELSVAQLLAVVCGAKPGAYWLRGPYYFGFPAVHIRLFRPLERPNGPAALGYFRASLMPAGSLRAAKTEIANNESMADGFVVDFGDYEVAHPSWLDDPRMTPDTPWFGGKVYYGE